MMNLTHNDLQLLESTQRIATSKIVNGVFVFDESTQDLSFVDLIHHKELREIRFITPQPNLRYLDASRCGLVQIVFSKRCDALQSIYLHRNQLTAFDIQVELPSLELLDLSFNEHLSAVQFKSVLPKLMYLYLHKCDLRDLEPLVGYFLREGFDFNIEGNGDMQNPPTAIVAQGKDAVIRHFINIKKEGKAYLYEAKLLILGDPRAGKTSLVNKIIDSTNLLASEDETTRGVDLTTWEFDYHFAKEGKQNVLVNIWDFGGQTIYKQTHRFFLTQRSVYVVLSDGGASEKTDFAYWMHESRTFGKESPVIVFINEKENRKYTIPYSDLQKINPSLKHDVAVNLKEVALEDSERFKTIIEILKDLIASLPHLGEAVSKNQKEIRGKLLGFEKERKKIISWKEYVSLCEKHKERDKKGQISLAQYFHDIGIFLHFHEDDILRKYIFLDKQWILNGAYLVVDSDVVEKAKGKMTKSEFNGLFDDEYDEYRTEITALLKQFSLIYEKDGYFVVPQHLAQDTPNPDDYWDFKENVSFRYLYKDYMPEGILWQFMVDNYKNIKDDLIWRRGIVLDFGDTMAEVSETYGRNLIKIRVKGLRKTDVRAQIIANLDAINRKFDDLDIEKEVPCYCEKCKESEKPTLFKYTRLLKMQLKNRDEWCENLDDEVFVDLLLQGFSVRRESGDNIIYKIKNYNEINTSGNGNVVAQGLERTKLDLQKGDTVVNPEPSEYLEKKFAGIHNHLTQQDAQLEDIKAIGQKYIDSLSESQKELNDSMNILIGQSEKAEMETILHEMQSMMNDQFKKDELAQINQLINNERTDMAVKMKFMIPLVIAKAEIEFSRKMKVPQTWQEFKALFVKNN